MKPVSAVEFVNEIKKAHAWTITETADKRLRLIVKDRDEIKEFLGPDPLEMDTDIEYRVFMNNVLNVTSIPAINRAGGFS